jgi:hypothetical protein
MAENHPCRQKCYTQILKIQSSFKPKGPVAKRMYRLILEALATSLPNGGCQQTASLRASVLNNGQTLGQEKGHQMFLHYEQPI